MHIVKKWGDIFNSYLIYLQMQLLNISGLHKPHAGRSSLHRSLFLAVGGPMNS